MLAIYKDLLCLQSTKIYYDCNLQRSIMLAIYKDLLCLQSTKIYYACNVQRSIMLVIYKDLLCLQSTKIYYACNLQRSIMLAIYKDLLCLQSTKIYYACNLQRFLRSGYQLSRSLHHFRQGSPITKSYFTISFFVDLDYTKNNLAGTNKEEWCLGLQRTLLMMILYYL